VLPLALTASLLLQATAPGADPVPSPTPEAAAEDRRTLRRLPANLGRGIVGVFHRDNVLPFVAGAVATGGATVLDADFRERINPNPDDGWGQTLETAGGPLWSAVFVGGMYGAARIARDERFEAATYDLVDATIMNVVYFQSLKLIVRRERPNGSNNQSFPSGHTSHAFAVATVFERHYGWKIGAPAYVFAGIVGASRMKEDMHYFSDVVAGAALGYIVGRTVVRVNGQPPPGTRPKASLFMAPLVGPGARGLQMSLVF
jgi:membrane-associated phospholipid phosphatase